MKITKRRALAIIGILALVSPAIVYAFTNYLDVTNTFTVGSNLQVAGVGLSYDIHAKVGGGAPTGGTKTTCTAGTFPVWTCPNPVSTLFGSDNMTLFFAAESDRATLPTSFTITAGTYSTFTTAAMYIQCTTSACAAFTGTMASGTPTLAAGTWYLVVLTAQLPATASTGPVTFAYSYGA